MEESECMVCFSKYDENEYRPRVMPCGHTMCSKCLEKSISEDSKMCPKCRTHYSASDPKDLPVNFSLEGLVKSMNISKCTNEDASSERVDQQLQVNHRLAETDRLPECIEHQLPVSRRCSTHKSWICDSCLIDEHSPEACKIITVTEELFNRKMMHVSQSLAFTDTFEETCTKSDDCKKQLKKQIEENDDEILEYETLVKILQDTIQKKKTRKKQMETNYVKFEQTLETIKGKKKSFDQALASLTFSATFRGLASCSVEVQKESKKLELTSKEMENEVDQMVEVFNNASTEPKLETFIENHRVSFRDGRIHLHALNGNVSPKSRSVSPKLPSNIFKYDQLLTGLPPVRDLVFLDLDIAGQVKGRVIIRLRQELVNYAKNIPLMFTGEDGASLLSVSCKKGWSCDLCMPVSSITGKINKFTRDAKAGFKVVPGSVLADWSGKVFQHLSFYHENGTNQPYDGKRVDVIGVIESGLDIVQLCRKHECQTEIRVKDCGVVIKEDKLRPLSII